MSSSFLKTSPYSSSYGLYGAGTVNPYASYFGPNPQSPTTSTSTSTPNPNQGSGGQSLTSAAFPSFGGSSLSQGPTGGFNMGPGTSTYVPSPQGGGGGFNLNASMSTNATSPRPLGGLGISGGSPPYFSPVTPQTRIIGGVNSGGVTPNASVQLRLGGQGQGQPSANLGHGVASPSSSSMWGFASPQSGGGSGRSIDDSSQHHESMHCSPISGSGSITSTSSPYGHHLGGQPGHLTHGPNPVYLPCYFLGLDQPHHYQGGGSPPSPGIGGGHSHGSGSGPGRLGGPGAFMSPPGARNVKRTVLFEPKSFPETEHGGTGDESRQAVKKAKGPPIHGFGPSEGASAKDFLEAVIRTETGFPNNNANASSLPSPNFGCNSTFSPCGNSTSHTTKCWVTIFGFPAGASSFIVTNFSTLGKIMEVKCTPGSNWLHIRFSDPIEARRALSRNGKVLGQSIMVGVIPSDAKVVEEAEKANISNSEANPNQSAAPSPILRERNVDLPSSSADALKSRIRPLASGYNYNNPQQTSAKMASPPRSVPGSYSSARDTFAVGRGNQSEGVPVPTPSTGIVTKTLEFFFGW